VPFDIFSPADGEYYPVEKIFEKDFEPLLRSVELWGGHFSESGKMLYLPLDSASSVTNYHIFFWYDSFFETLLSWRSNPGGKIKKLIADTFIPSRFRGCSSLYNYFPCLSLRR